jgi:hypothetical protein
MERMLQIRNLGPILAQDLGFRPPKSQASFVTAPRKNFKEDQTSRNSQKLSETPAEPILLRV